MIRFEVEGAAPDRETAARELESIAADIRAGRFPSLIQPAAAAATWCAVDTDEEPRP